MDFRLRSRFCEGPRTIRERGDDGPGLRNIRESGRSENNRNASMTIIKNSRVARPAPRQAMPFERCGLRFA